jgi:N-acetylmuramoyl-L-alanine amidase
VKQAPFVVLVGVNMPAALVELGFLTHPAEARKLRQRKYQQDMANAISDAVGTYYQTRGPREAGVPPSKQRADR